MPLTNAQEKLVRHVKTRHGRRKTGMFLCEGVRCCREALVHRPELCEFAIFSNSFTASTEYDELADMLVKAGKSAVVVEDHQLAKLAATENSQGVLCLFRRIPSPPADQPVADPFILVLDRVSEPGNIGTILRTAWAIGLHEVWLTEGAADPFSPKVIRAGMGAQFTLELRLFSDLPAVKKALEAFGIRRIWLSMPNGTTNCYAPEFELRGSALIIGNETDGVGEMAGADSVFIPMPGNAESLNVAQAATLLMFEGVRRGLFTNP